MKQALAEFIHLRMFQLNLTERDLIKRLGAEPPNVNRIRNGTAAIPLDKIEFWCSVLELDDFKQRSIFLDLCLGAKAAQRPEASLRIRHLESEIEAANERDDQWRRRLLHSHAAMQRAIELLGAGSTVEIQHRALEILRKGFHIGKVDPHQIAPLNDVDVERDPTVSHDPADEVDWYTPPSLPLKNLSDAKVASDPSEFVSLLLRMRSTPKIFPKVDGVPDPCIYEVEFLDVNMRFITGDVFFVAGRNKLESRISKLTSKLSKAGLPRGWHLVKVSRPGLNKANPSIYWSINSETLEIQGNEE